ncbi:MAG: DNA-methyltransferase [Candidatus Micrarchaeaceae archaeon]
MKRIIHGDCLKELKRLNDDSIDLVCTDPPYGYSFMGKNWDKAVPSVEIWKECVRVLKPGAFAFIMSAPRQDVLSQMIVRIAEAGFDTDFTSIYWTYASGFPKAANIGKMVDRRLGRARNVIGRNPNSRENATKANSLYEPGTVGKTAHITRGNHPLEGSYGGFQPKPAVEVIIVAMKPLSEKTFVDQALKNGKGITWLDDCRNPIGDESVPRLNKAYKRKGGRNFGDGADSRLGTITGHESLGRFAANLLVDDNVLGDHSRFFAYPFLITPKASKREKNYGLDGLKDVVLARSGGAQQAIKEGRTEYLKDHIGLNRVMRVKNNHPTVKPLKLISYLLTLGSRKGDTVLDPFLGSGTTCIAAKMLNRNYIGIEREMDYHKIARARVRAA